MQAQLDAINEQQRMYAYLPPELGRMEQYEPPKPSRRPHELTIMQWVREERNRLLEESDWTQVPDAPLSDEERKAWREYRQALRDVPQAWGLNGKECSVDLSIVRTREDIERLPWPSISSKENK